MKYRVYYLDLSDFVEKFLESNNNYEITEFIMNCSTISKILKVRKDGKELAQKKYTF